MYVEIYSQLGQAAGRPTESLLQPGLTLLHKIMILSAESRFRDIIRNFFSSGGFMPHGHCYLWNPGILWVHILSDALIATAYFSIPCTLVYFIRKRKDL